MGTFCAHKNDKVDNQIANYMGITPYQAFLLRQGYATYSGENKDIIDEIYNNPEVIIGNKTIKTKTLEEKLQQISNLLSSYQSSPEYMTAAINLQSTNLAATFENLFYSMQDGRDRLDSIDTVTQLFMDFVTRLQGKYGGSRQNICNDSKHGTSYILWKLKQTLDALAKNKIDSFKLSDGTIVSRTNENAKLFEALVRNFEAIACFSLSKLHNTEGLRFNKKLNVVEDDDLISSNKNPIEELYNFEESIKDAWQELKECISPVSTVGKHVRAALTGLKKYNLIIKGDEFILEPEINKFGLYRHANISEVHQGLMRVLRGMTSSEDMINKLKNYVAESEKGNKSIDKALAATIRDLLVRLTPNAEEDAKLNNEAHLDYINMFDMLKSAFYSDLKRNKTEYATFSINRLKNGITTYKRAVINRSNSHTDQFENFLTLLQLGCVYNKDSKSSIFNGNKATALKNIKLITKNIEEFGSVRESVTARTEKLQNILENIGIDCNVNQTYKLLNNKQFIEKLKNFGKYGLQLILDIEKQNKGHFKNTKDFFTNREKDSLTDNDKITDVRYNKVTKQFKEILDYFVSESEGSILDAGLYRKNGKFVRMYTDVAPSYMADRIEEIKDAVENNSISQLRDIIEKRYLRNAIYVDMDKNGAIKDVNGKLWNRDSTVPPAIKNQWLRLLWNSAEVVVDKNTKETKETGRIAEGSFARKLNWTRILGNVKGKDGIDIDATDFADFDIDKHAVAMLRNFLHHSEIIPGKKGLQFGDFPVFILGDANVFKSITGPRVSTSRTDDWVDLLYEVYEQERARINLFEKTNEKLEKEGYKKVENTYRKVKDEDENEKEESTTEYVYLKFINDYNKNNTIKFENLSKKDKRKEIQKAVEEEVKIFQQRMRALGIYDITEITEGNVKKKYSQFRGYNSEEAIDRLTKDFYINNKIATIQQFQIMTVDIGYYKNSKDLQKRYKEIHAPGNEMDVYAKWNGQYILQNEDGEFDISRKGVYFEDIIGNAEEYDPEFMDVVALQEGLRMLKSNKPLSQMTPEEIEKIKKQGRKSKIYEDYKKCTYTDGQSFITIHTMRKVMILQGKWNKDYENKYNQIASLSRAINNAKTDEEKTKLKSQIIELGVVFQPIKPYGFTHERYPLNDGTDAMIPTQYKCAEAVIIPAILPEGSKLRALGEFLEGKHLDYACSTQCIKVGNFGAVNITNTKAADLANVLSKAYIHVSSWEDYKIQTNVPHHMSGERSMGTQIRKIILSQIKKNKVYSNYFEKLNTGGEGIVLDTKDGVKRKAATGTNLIDLYNSLISCGIYESLQQFKQDIEDPTVFSEILQHNVLNNNRDSLSKLLNYVLNDDQTAFDTELWEGGNAFDAQNLLLSIFRKLVNKQMFEGASLVQVSAWGTKQEDIIRDENLRSICHNGNVLYYQCVIPFILSYTNQFGQKIDLKFEDYCHSDGSLIMSNDTTDDMEYASWENPDYEKNGSKEGTKFMIPKIEKEFPGILDQIAYRIPTERNYSCLNLKVVRSCSPAEGGIIKVPLPTTIVAGFDFDIDKLYLLRKTFVERKSGKTVQDVFDKVYELIAKDLGYSETETLTNQLEQALGTKPTKDNPLHKVWDKVPILANYNKDEWFAKAAEMLGYNKKDEAEYDWTKAPSQQTQSNDKVKNLKAAKRNNAIFHLMRCRLMDPETLKSRITPGGFKNPKIAGKVNRELMYNGDSNIADFNKLVDIVEDDNWNDPEPNWDPTDAYTMLYYNQQNQIASKLIGVFANANTFKQYASVAWSIKLRTPISMMGQSFDDLLNNHEDRDSDLTLAEFLAASVDAVKDPVLNYLNLNEHTVNVACLLGAIGYNPTEIGIFLNQPIIKEAVKESQKNGSSLSKSIRKILENESTNGVFEKFSYDSFSEDEKQENLSFETLCNNIRGILDEKQNKNWRTDINEAKSQYVVAHQLLDCLASANDFTMLVQSTKFTASNSVTSTFGGLYEQQMKLDQFYQGEIELRDGTIQKNGLSNIEITTKERQENTEDNIFVPIFNDGDMYNSSLSDYIKTVMRTPFGFEQAMFDANKALLQVTKNYFPYEADLYKNVRKIASNTKVNGVVTADTVDQLHDYILLSLLKNLPNSPFNPNSTIISDGKPYKSKEYFTQIFPASLALVIESTSIADKYPFLKRLLFRRYGENLEDLYYTINVDCNSLAEDFMDDDVIQGWDQMIRSSDENIRRIAIDLFFYNFHTGGFRFGYNMFMNLCPNSVKKSIIASITNDQQIGYLETLKDIREEHMSNLGFSPTQLLWNFVQENPDNKDFVRTLYGSNKDKNSPKAMFRNAITVAAAEAKDDSSVTIVLDGNENGENNKLYKELKQGKKMITTVINGSEQKILADVFPVAIQITGQNGNELYIANYSENYIESYTTPANVAEDKIITYTKVDTIKTRVFDDSDNSTAAVGTGSISDFYYEDVTKDPSYDQIKKVLKTFIDKYLEVYNSDSDFESSELKNLYDNLELKPGMEHQQLSDINFIDPKELFKKLKGDPTANYRNFIKIVAENLIDSYYKEDVINLSEEEKSELIEQIQQASFWNRKQSWNSIDANISYIIQTYNEGQNVQRMDSDYTLNDLQEPGGRGDVDFFGEEGPTVISAEKAKKMDKKLTEQAARAMNAAQGLAGNPSANVTQISDLSCK